MITLTRTLEAWIGMTDSQKLQELIQNDSFCAMAWNHQFMDPTGRVKPCCRFEEAHRPTENHLSKSSLQELFQGPWMSSLREKMERGEAVDGCTRCYQEQNAGKKSLRQRYNSSAQLPLTDLVDLKKPQIKWLELAISNQCNLACRMCDSRYSWKWFDEELAMTGVTKSSTKDSKMDIQKVFQFIPDLVHLKFTGGEPLITKDHWVLIEKLIGERDCSKIFLNYSTNCTIFPKTTWVQMWDRFKFVEFALSFDSVDKNEAEYIRWPAKFDTIEETTRAFFELSRKGNYRLILRTTVSVFNVWHLPETILWWLENHPPQENLSINPTHLTHPDFLSVTVLPSAIKRRISDKFNLYLSGDYPQALKRNLEYINNYMHSADETEKLKELSEYIAKTDQYRKQNFFALYPQFYDIFEPSAFAKSGTSENRPEQ